MVYSNKIVGAVKVAGQVLRETGNVVTLPFGSEYSVFIKNLATVRAQVKVSIDGQDATEGTWLIVDANGSLDLERFIKNGNWNKGNRFKFIERTAQIEKHRGIEAEDGLVRIEYKFEKQKPIEVPVVHKHYHHDYYDYHYWPYYYPKPYYWPDRTIWCNSGPIGSLQTTLTNSSGLQGGQQNQMMAMNCSLSESAEVERGNDVGITVPGSESNQQFVQGAWFDTEAQSDVIVIKLRGEVAGKKVAKAVTTKSKSTCPTCGTKSKNAQFCSNCGTALQII